MKKWLIPPLTRYSVQVKGPIQYAKRDFFFHCVGHFPFNEGNALWWHSNAKSLSRKAGETAVYVSNSSVLLRLEFSLLVLAMTVQDLFLMDVGMGELVELAHLLTGVIKSVEDSLPEKYQSRHPQGRTTLRVRNPAVFLI